MNYSDLLAVEVDGNGQTTRALALDIDGPRALVEGDVVTVMDGANQDHWPALARAELVDHTEVEAVAP